MNFPEYHTELEFAIKQECIENGYSSSQAFLNIMLEKLFEFDLISEYETMEMDDTKVANSIVRVDAYSIDSTEKSLTLYISDYSLSTDRLMQGDLDKLYWRMQYFLQTACENNNLSKCFSKSRKVLQAAAFIRKRMTCPVTDEDRFLKVRFCIFTNRILDTKLISQSFFEEKKKKHGIGKQISSKKRIKKDSYLDRPVEIDLWPIERIFELETAGTNEPIEIGFDNDFNSVGIPCIKCDLGSVSDYEAYLGIIPGKLLADIYIEYGSRVLEGNVRAFLGTKSAKGVNNGIKRTINNEPEKFFTYNNGIAATASDVITEIIDDQLYVTGITDLQIINGGQTTATLAEAVLKKTNISLDGIFVPVKLTVLADRTKSLEDGVLVYDKMIHDIARFANSQNKVTAADLFSNDPFHIWMEKISKKIFAPTIKYPIPTGWYYERARKKYQQEQMKLKGVELKRFEAKFPKKQIIKKEELALYLAAIECKPHLCARGKNWVMKDFGIRIGEIFNKDKAIFNDYYFKKCICAAIIYRRIDDYLESNKKDPNFWYSVGGYKSVIIPFTIAKILDAIPSDMSLDWVKIWNIQDVPPGLMADIQDVTYMVNEYFCGLEGVLISEYCKKEAVWDSIRSIPYKLSHELTSELILASEEQKAYKDSLLDQRSNNELEEIIELFKKGAIYWENLLDKGIRNNLLNINDQRKLQDMVCFIKKGSIPASSSGKIPRKTKQLIQDAKYIEGILRDDGITSFMSEDDEDVLLVLKETDRMK